MLRPSIGVLRRLFLTVAVISLMASAVRADGPNIIHIFADDLGKGSIGLYGQLARESASLPHIKTPNLDAMAASGLAFNKAYAATLCSPSRGMLYLGFNQAHNANDRNTVNPRAQDVTLGDVMKGAGYNTSVYGKWGFGGSGGTQTSGAKENDLRINPSVTNTAAVPTTQGYDEFTGYINHTRAHRFYTSSLWTTDPTGNPVTAGLSEMDLGNTGPGNTNLHNTYTHDVIAAESEQFIEDHYNDAAPFFMQVNYTIPHNDLEAIQFEPGWFDAYAGVNTSSWTAKEQYYAAMITRMDASIGDLFDKLRDPNGDGNQSDSIMDNTLIVFTSDNGATNADFSVDGLNHFGINDELRGGKRDLWEGGIQMPQFAVWEGTIAPGTTTDHQTDLTDFMATIADLAGVQAPVGIDGHSLAPLLTGQGIQRSRDYLIFEHHEGDGPDPNGLDARWAILREDYKLIKFSNGERRLYNLATDPDENNQLNQGIPANADLVAELTAIALAEGVEQGASYDHQYAAWTGGDGNELNNGANWDLGSQPFETWSTTVNNTSGSDAVALANLDVDTLGFEVQGDSGKQTVRVYRKKTLTGRNAVRIDNGGRIHLDDATLESWRWTDVLAGGELTGHGTVEDDVYNFGTIAPGLPSDLPQPADPPQPPQGVDTGVISAIVFDFTGIQDNAPLTQTSTLYEHLTITEGFNFGPGVQPRNAANAGNEFNVTGFAGNGTTLSTAITNNDYLGFKVDPVFGIEMLVDTVSIQLWRNGSGAAQEYAILTSLDGFTSGSELATLNTTSGDTSTHVLNGSYTGGVWTTDEVDVRIYGWDQEGANGNTHFNAVSMTASFRTIAGGGDPPVVLDPTGTLNLTGNFWHVAGGMIEMDLGGTDNSDPLDPQFDNIAVTGATDLAGGLTLALDGGHSPALGDVYVILTSDSITGHFDNASVTTPNLPDVAGKEIALGLLYEDTADPSTDIDQVRVVTTYKGDANGDGNVNPTDLAALTLNWLSSDATWQGGDFNYDGNVNPTDLAALTLNWLEAVPGGIPAPDPGGGGGGIPEPTSLVLLGLGGLMIARRRLN